MKIIFKNFYIKSEDLNLEGLKLLDDMSWTYPTLADKLKDHYVGHPSFHNFKFEERETPNFEKISFNDFKEKFNKRYKVFLKKFNNLEQKIDIFCKENKSKDIFFTKYIEFSLLKGKYNNFIIKGFFDREKKFKSLEDFIKKGFISKDYLKFFLETGKLQKAKTEIGVIGHGWNKEDFLSLSTLDNDVLEKIIINFFSLKIMIMEEISNEDYLS